MMMTEKPNRSLIKKKKKKKQGPEVFSCLYVLLLIVDPAQRHVYYTQRDNWVGPVLYIHVALTAAMPNQKPKD